jgi:hypothetical protein
MGQKELSAGGRLSPLDPKCRPHPKNVPGPFYVVDGCCTACGVPESVAPDLFSWDGNSHCYVSRQPANPDETEKALHAIRGAEFRCIRYRGADREVLIRLAELGEAEICDVAPPASARPVLRNHVTFDSSAVDVQRWEGRDLARSFASYLVGPVTGPNPSRENRVRRLVDSEAIASLEYAWFEDNFHRVLFRRIDLPMGRWLIWHFGNLAVSEDLNDWLVAEPRISNVRWYSELSWSTDQSWRQTPW